MSARSSRSSTTRWRLFLCPATWWAPASRTTAPKTEFFDPGADLMSYVPFYPTRMSTRRRPTAEPLEGLEDNAFYCWRVRYRDRSLACSEWSTPVPFAYDADGVGVAEGCDNPEPLAPFVSDASTPDGGAEAPPAGGCSCRAARPQEVRSYAVLLVLGFFASRVGRRSLDSQSFSGG